MTSPLAAIPAGPGPLELAARIRVPVTLPRRADDTPLVHLSVSSLTRFISCPEDWRRHYIHGHRHPPTGAMFLGSRVDDALCAYYTHQLAGHQLTTDDVCDLYTQAWEHALVQEAHRHGDVHWQPDLPHGAAKDIGAQAVRLAMTELVPELGTPVCVQRRVELRLAPDAHWSIIGYLDLETTDHATSSIVDFKVKNDPITQAKADRDPQAALYLAARHLEGNPASNLRFAQITKPGKRRKTIATSLVSTTRTAAQMNAILIRFALAAEQITALYERFGPDRPWGFADPTGWKCAERYCSHYRTCPGGADMQPTQPTEPAAHTPEPVAA